MIRLLFLFFSIPLCLPAQSQPSTPDTTASTDPAIREAIARYHQEAGFQSQLYNGRMHIYYPPALLGIPYFLSNEPQTGTVEFEELLFEGVPLWYDEVRDKVVVQHFNRISAFELNSERVDGFTIGTHRFIRIVRDSLRDNTPPTSFYEVLCQGPLTILVRRRKMIIDFIENMEAKQRVDDKVNYYALRNGVYYPVNNERSFMAVIRDKKPEVQQMLKREKIRFRKTPEAALVKAGHYYNQITSH